MTMLLYLVCKGLAYSWYAPYRALRWRAIFGFSWVHPSAFMEGPPSTKLIQAMPGFRRHFCCVWTKWNLEKSCFEDCIGTTNPVCFTMQANFASFGIFISDACATHKVCLRILITLKADIPQLIDDRSNQGHKRRSNSGVWSISGLLSILICSVNQIYQFSTRLGHLYMNIVQRYLRGKGICTICSCNQVSIIISHGWNNTGIAKEEFHCSNLLDACSLICYSCMELMWAPSLRILSQTLYYTNHMGVSKILSPRVRYVAMPWRFYIVLSVTASWRQAITLMLMFTQSLD